MIIDFHTHIFPEALAPKAVGALEKSSGTKAALTGRRADLIASMERCGIDYSVNMPIASKPSQTPSINNFAIEVNGKQGLFSFGGVHPLYEGWREELERLQAAGLKGIKLHPDFQDLFIDDEPMVRLMQAAAELGLMILIHGGEDISFPEVHHCTPRRLCKVLPRLPRDTVLVAAHLGGWRYLNDVEELLVGKELYLDTSYTIGQFEQAQIERILLRHDSQRLLFGSDSPWEDQGQAAQKLLALRLPDELKEKILSGNARRLLGV